jgi:hypothetical protein
MLWFETPSRRARCRAAGLAAAAFAGMLAVTGLPALLSAQGAPQTADLVVDLSDGRVVVKRIDVAGPATTGLALLQRAQVGLVENGGAVCTMAGTGCPASNCFCDPDRYWSYYHGSSGGGWAASNDGPGQYVVPAGAVEGWEWGGDRPPISATAATRAVLLGFEWLATQQLADGSQAQHSGLTAEYVLAARGAGADANAQAPGRSSAVEYLRRTAELYSRDGVAQTGKLAVAVAAAGEDPHQFGGVDLPARLVKSYDAGKGQFGKSVWDQSWALLGLAASDDELPAASAAYLADAAAAGGGWGFSPDATAADADSTGLALQALMATGAPVTPTAVAEAIGWLKGMQGSDGGWGHDPNEPSNVNSTAYAVQGLLAAGEDPTAPRWTTAGGANPVTYLLATQDPDGRFAFRTAPADLVATLQVLPALAGRPAPATGRGVAVRKAVDWMLTQRTPDGGFNGFNPGATLDAVLALASHGRPANPPAASGQTPLDYLSAEAPAYSARGASAAGKLLVGAVALAGDPRSFGGVDLVAAVQATRNVTGTYGSGGTWDTSWPILGLAAAGEPVPESAARGLLAEASPAGGWGFGAQAGAPDVESTGLALQALAASDLPDDDRAVQAARTSALLFLRTQQDPAGAFIGFGAVSANSTGLALGGLAAAGQWIEGPGWMRGKPGALARWTPVEGLLRLQSPRGGFAGYSGPDDAGATYAAVLGLALRGLPVEPMGVDGRTVFLPLTLVRRR